MEAVNNVIVISDTHAGCAVALCPPNVRLDSGGIYNQGPTQKKIWAGWRYFWDKWVPMVTRGEPFAVVHNGDALDGAHHGAKTQITQNFSDQENIAYEVLAPVVERCGGRYYHVRGTEAHVGQCAENEERLARRLGAVPTEGGNYSRYDLWLRVGHALCHFTHHIGASGSHAYRSSAPMRELTELLVNSALWGHEAPDIVVRCLSDDTEILTRNNGWVGIDSYTDGDEVATFNTFTDEIQWQVPSARVVHEDEPEMINMTGKGMDILVTPDHTMVVRTATGRWGVSGWYPLQMQDLYDAMGSRGRSGSQRQIPLAGKYAGAGVQYTTAQMWLLGFIMADGHIVKREEGHGYALRIAQVAEREVEVDLAIEAAGIPKCKSRVATEAGTVSFDRRHNKYITTNKDVMSWYIPNEHAMPLIEALEPDKTLKPWMLEMTADQCHALIAGFHYGDGAKSGNKLFNNNKKMFDQFQELMVKHGYKSSVCERGGYVNKSGAYVPMYVMHYTRGKPAIGVGQKAQGHTMLRVPYGRRSWCVTVPNGTLVTRRNGCVAIVGNSHVHQHIQVTEPSRNTYGIVFTTPGWQAKTPFVWKIPGGRYSETQIGGALIRCGDEEAYTRHWVQSLGRSIVCEVPMIKGEGDE